VVNAADADEALDHGYDLIAVGRACIAYPDWTAASPPVKAGAVYRQHPARSADIPEPLWRFSLVEAMIRDMSMGESNSNRGCLLRKFRTTPTSW
jgi:fumarate reductase flavoprotein subunit